MEVPAHDLLALSDKELVDRLTATPELVDGFRQMIEDVYGEENLVEERKILSNETQSTKAPKLGRLATEKLKILLKMRAALSSVFHTGPFFMKQDENLTKMVIDMQDGDFAYSTYQYVGGHADCGLILGDVDYRKFINELRFSPELQEKIARSNEYASIPLDLAWNHYLTPEAQMLLFNHEHFNARTFVVSNSTANAPELLRAVFAQEGEQGERNRRRVLFSRKEFSPEIVEEIEKDPLLNPIYMAKTDPASELQLIQQGIQSADKNLMAYIAHGASLLSEEAVRLLYVNDKNGELPFNKNLSKYPALVKELGLVI